MIKQLKYLAIAYMVSAILFDVFVLTRLLNTGSFYINKLLYNGIGIIMVAAIIGTRVLRSKINADLMPETAKAVETALKIVIVPLIGLIVIALLFKIQHWVGGGIVYLLAGLALMVTITVLNLVQAVALLKHYNFLSRNQL